MSTSNHRSTSMLGVLALLVLAVLVVFGIKALTDTSGGGMADARAVARPAGAPALSDAVQRDDTAGIKAALTGGGDVNAPIATDKPGREGLTPLSYACMDGKPETVRALLDAKAKTEVRTADGHTALMYAAGWGDPAKVKMLLDAGARTDARASDGWTALMWAAARGEPASVQELVRAGADVNAANKWRQTALMAAARTGSLDKVSFLLEAGSNAAAVDANGDTALSIGASNEVPPGVLEALAKAGCPVDAADNDGVTALMKSAERGDLEQVRALVKLGADKAKKDKANGWTARDWAAKRDDGAGKAVVAFLDGK